MKKPQSIKALENFGRIRLSRNFFMRDFLHSEISNFYAIPNIPDNPDTAIKAGTKLCEELLEPLQNKFGRLAIRGAYRNAAVNKFGNDNKLNCAKNSSAFSHHVWDRHDKYGFIGAMACIVVPWFAERYEKGADWRAMAWWVHDNLPYSNLCFFPKLAAFNIGWHENPQRRIDSYIAPRGNLTKPGKDNHDGDHSRYYSWFPQIISGKLRKS